MLLLADPLGADLAARTAGHLPEAVLTYSLSNKDAAVFAEKVKVSEGTICHYFGVFCSGDKIALC